MIRVIGWLLVALATPPHRIYWPVALEQLATSTRTHVCVTGTVRYVRHQADGDVHVTLDKGRAKVVLEIIPALPLPAPRKGQRITACGIRRYDGDHGWAEVHPVERWSRAK